MTPVELRRWLARYDATPPEDARRRQAIRESMVLHTPDLVRELLDLREAVETLSIMSADAVLANQRRMKEGKR